MTWNVDDLEQNKKQFDLAPIEDTEQQQEEEQVAYPENVPYLGLYQQVLNPSTQYEPTIEESRYMKYMGMIPDKEWGKIRKRMTRGIQPLW